MTISKKFDVSGMAFYLSGKQGFLNITKNIFAEKHGLLSLRD